MRSLFLAAALSFCLSAAVHAATAAPSFSNYPFDDAPLKKYPKESSEWQILKDEGSEKPADKKSLSRQLELLEILSKAEPDWIDGYWLRGEAAFHLASAMASPKDRDEARAIFLKGQEATEACLKKAPANPLCKMFLGASMGKIGSIDGIFSSLKKASTMEALLLDVTKSGVNYTLSPISTLQGSARYALGLFYRLVPDSSMISWMFNTRGNIEKSISYHRSALETDASNPCSVMMLGVALICSAKGDLKSSAGKEGQRYLTDAKALPVKSSLSKTCNDGISKIEQDPSLACGYETSRQQEEGDEGLKKLESAK